MTVVTADDLGLCAEIDEAIFTLHDRGVVGRTSVLATGDTFEAAVNGLRERPRLEVALHLNLTDGCPLLPARDVPSLVNRTGHLRGASHYATAAALATGRMRLDEVYAEWRAQAQRVTRAGIQVSELNAHGHLHLLPHLHDVVRRLRREFGVPRVRLVRSREWPKGRVLAACSALLSRRLARDGVDTREPAQTLGLRNSGGVDPTIDLCALAANSAPIELIVHPAVARNAYHDAWGYDGPAVTTWLLGAAGRFVA